MHVCFRARAHRIYYKDVGVMQVQTYQPVFMQHFILQLLLHPSWVLLQYLNRYKNSMLSIIEAANFKCKCCLSSLMEVKDMTTLMGEKKEKEEVKWYEEKKNF